MVNRPRDAAEGAIVLIVEDEAIVCAFLAKVLERAGHTVVCVETSADALERLADNPSIGLLITDLTLPGIDGLELIRRAREHRERLAALVVSGYALDERGLGPIGFLQKPFSAHTLVEKVRELLTDPSRR
jgi:CheY-like chemotaxis protein